MLPLEQWSEDYLRTEVLQLNESSSIELKAEAKFELKRDGKPNGETKAELAKQTSAFLNSGDGFLIYGVTDAGNLDAGVPELVGRQPITEWVEAAIPSLVFPAAHKCSAKLINVPAHHAHDRGVLVVSIPLSDGRPHWDANSETAYVRAGAHSLPMRPQTLVDLASRGSSSQILIEGLNPIGTAQVQGHSKTFRIQPTVRMIGGRSTENWGFELFVKSGQCKFQFPSSSPARLNDQNRLYLIGEEVLFPGRSTPVAPHPFHVQYNESQAPLEISAHFYADSARPAQRTFEINDLDTFRKQIVG